MKFLMVCLGNICRSPLAEGILKQKIKEHGLDWEVESAGTGAWHVGECPDQRAIAIANKYGLDISGQAARQFSPYDYELYDRILVMDTTNYTDVMRMANNNEERQKVRLMLDYLNPGERRSVPDPYWNDDGFDQVFRLLDKACEALVQKELEAQSA